MRHLSFGLLLFLMIGRPIVANAQIIPDNTLPTASRVTPQGNIQAITDGTSSGSNLFHSFNQFSIAKDTTAQFRHAPTIRNLFVRVTGNLIANLDGKLETALTNDLSKRGEANLFLLNPNGITFGKNSSLNLGGSFIVSTADRLRLSNGSEFSARNPQPPVLTVAVPVGLQFGNNPGDIENQSLFRQGSVQVGLQVPNGKTLALLGGNIRMAGGALSVANGKIELAAIGSNGRSEFDLVNPNFSYGDSSSKDIVFSNNGLIRLIGNTNVNANLTARNVTFQSGDNDQTTGISASTTTAKGLISVNAKGLLQISGTRSRILSTISGSGKGTDIQIQAQNLQLSQGGDISTFTQGEGTGGDLNVNVNNTIRADGRESGLFVNSQGTNTQPAKGNAGNLNVKARALSFIDGAQINSISGNSSGNSGNIALIISDEVKLSGADVPIDQKVVVKPTVISTQTLGSGNAGSLIIATNQLDILGGAQVITSTLGSGNAGELTIQAKDVRISGAAQAPNGQFVISPSGNRLGSAITSDAQRRSTGQGADLKITTDRLTVRDGGVIQAATFGSGNAGNVAIIAKESIRLEGVAPTPDDPFPSSIIAFSGGIPNRKVFNVPEATGKGGNITIDTPNLKLTDGALIALGSLNSTATAQGAGELLKITADVISLDRAELNAETNFGNGGNMNLTANQLLLLRNGSKITTQSGIAQKSGDAGNIEINAPFIFAVATENSDINANAFSGKGGNVKLTAQSGRILGLEKRLQPTALSDITASSQKGVQGTITIADPDIDPDRGTVPLPATTSDPSNRIDQSCSANSSISSQFTVARNGGLPAAPMTAPANATLPRLASWPQPSVTTPPAQASNPTIREATIREAQASQRLANGKIRFTATTIGAATPSRNSRCQ
jgi:filamentous hemagglutinin family protein